MKRPITPALLSFLLLASCQREAPAPATPAIPDAVAKSFQQAHPELKSTGWEMEDGNVATRVALCGPTMRRIRWEQPEVAFVRRERFCIAQ